MALDTLLSITGLSKLSATSLEASDFNYYEITNMTKKVRIENADTTSYKVVVQVWDKGMQLPDGFGGFTQQAPDVMAFERVLNNPCDITGDGIYLTSTRYLIVKEA